MPISDGGLLLKHVNRSPGRGLLGDWPLRRGDRFFPDVGGDLRANIWGKNASSGAVLESPWAVDKSESDPRARSFLSGSHGDTVVIGRLLELETFASQDRLPTDRMP